MPVVVRSMLIEWGADWLSDCVRLLVLIKRQVFQDLIKYTDTPVQVLGNEDEATLFMIGIKYRVCFKYLLRRSINSINE